MKNIKQFFVLSFLGILFSFPACKRQDQSIHGLKKLNQPVEVIRDQWGVNHIYAKDQHDLFYTQGYMAASDRLFQFEVWRRQATGTVAEILGVRELKRDIGTRLFMFRGDMKTEMDHYHPEGEKIIQAYVDGVNAYIQEALKDPDHLPVEFKLLNIKPKLWTPEVVISRHQGLLGNIGLELNTGRAVAKIGAEKVNELAWFHPQKPILKLDPALNGNLLDSNILELYNAYRNRVRFRPSDINPAFRRKGAKNRYAALLNSSINGFDHQEARLSTGSNNWVISGKLTGNGHTVMANDPHRSITIPSLRYMVHLVAPGWNVIGAGEPEIPGISIGHNEYGAWGLTVFRTDGEDLYVYELNPENSNQYLYQGKWEKFKTLNETIKVKGASDTLVLLKYTRHGPVCYVDTLNHKAYAVRCAWLEPGGAPYLASLRMDQSKSWEEFREACKYSNIPGENMVWAGKNGTIGWQAVGIAPIRRNFSGLVPVPGDGRYEWEGYLPIKEKPHLVNPEKGFFESSNQNITPENYTHWDAIGYSWSDPYRGERITKVLASHNKFTMKEMEALQNDYYSLPAQALVPFLKYINFETKQAREAKNLLLSWDLVLNKTSIPAGIYAEWEHQIMKLAGDRFVPEEVRGLISLQLTKVISWIEKPEKMFEKPAEKNRDLFLRESFQKALNVLTERLGSDLDTWQYGQEKYKHITIHHALSGVVNNEFRKRLNTATAIRGGNAYCPGVTGSTSNQTRGASFRIIVNTGDWDNARAINTPGQSGNPDSPFYTNLFKMWANDRYFPLYYSKEKIESFAVEKLKL